MALADVAGAKFLSPFAKKAPHIDDDVGLGEYSRLFDQQSSFLAPTDVDVSGNILQ